MAETELSILVKMKNEASAQLKQVSGEIETATKSWNDNFKEVAETIRSVGYAMAGMGTAILAPLGLAAKAAEEERVGIMQLSQALYNVGQNYEYVEGQIEAVIAAQQRKTNYGDGEQRAALSALIYTTGDYYRSMEQLPLVLDLAAGKQMDVTTAAEVVGRVMQGNTTILSRYGIQLEEGATATEALTALTKAFGGSAQAMLSPVTQLKNYIGDLAETIGAILLPIIRDFVNGVIPVIESIRIWMDQHPRLTQFIVIASAAIGVLLVGLGTLAILIPTIINLQKAWIVVQGVLNAVMSANPIGLIILAVGALIAIVALLVANWEHVVDFFKWLWEGIKDIFVSAINGLIQKVEEFVNFFIQAINLVPKALNAIGKAFGADWNIPTIEEISIPRLAQGGIVTRPTLALVGESGPEAVVPLSSGRGTGTVVNVTVQGNVVSESDLVDAVYRGLLRKQSQNVSLGIA